MKSEEETKEESGRSTKRSHKGTDTEIKPFSQIATTGHIEKPKIDKATFLTPDGEISSQALNIIPKGHKKIIKLKRKSKKKNTGGKGGKKDKDKTAFKFDSLTYPKNESISLPTPNLPLRESSSLPLNLKAVSHDLKQINISNVNVDKDKQEENNIRIVYHTRELEEKYELPKSVDNIIISNKGVMGDVKKVVLENDIINGGGFRRKMKSSPQTVRPSSSYEAQHPKPLYRSDTTEGRPFIQSTPHNNLVIKIKREGDRRVESGVVGFGRDFKPNIISNTPEKMRSLRTIVGKQSECIGRPESAGTGEGEGKTYGFRRYLANTLNKPIMSSASLLSCRLNQNKLQVSNLLSSTIPISSKYTKELTPTQMKAVLAGKSSLISIIPPSPKSRSSHSTPSLPKTEFDFLYSINQIKVHPYPLIIKANSRSKNFSNLSISTQNTISKLELKPKETELFSLFEGAKLRIMQNTQDFRNAKFQEEIYQILWVLQTKYLQILEGGKLREIKERIKEQRAQNEREMKEGLKTALSSEACHIDFDRFDAVFKEQTNLFEQCAKRIHQANKALEYQKNKAMPIDTNEMIAEFDENSFQRHYTQHRGFFSVMKQRMRRPVFKAFYKSFSDTERRIQKLFYNKQEKERRESLNPDVHMEHPDLLRISSKLDGPVSAIEEYRNLWDIIYKFLTSNEYLKGCYSTIFQYVKREETDIYEKLFKVNYKSIELILYDFMIGMVSKQLLEEKMNNLFTLQKVINIQRVFRQHLQPAPLIR